MEQELNLFDEDEMQSGIIKPCTDEEQIVSAYVEAIRIVDELDDTKAYCLWKECTETEHHGQKIYYLPGYFFDVIQYGAVEDCLLARLFPSHTSRITVPFAYEEALKQFRQASI